MVAWGRQNTLSLRSFHWHMPPTRLRNLLGPESRPRVDLLVKDFDPLSNLVDMLKPPSVDLHFDEDPGDPAA